MSDSKHITVKKAICLLRELGFVLTSCNGEYRLNKKGGSEASAYYTDDLVDAVQTAKNWNGFSGLGV